VKEVEAFLQSEKRAATVPAIPSPTEVADQKQVQSGALVLVVDDSPVNLELIKSTLTPSGYRVVTTESVGAAMNLARHYAFELILSDLHMAPEGGLEFLRRVKTNANLQSIPFLLLAFGRRQVLDPRVLDLRVVFGDLETLMRSVLGENIELEFLCDEHLASVEVDPGQLEQVLMNLAINAHDAMPSGGMLTFAASNVRLEEAYVARRTVVRPGEYVQLAVSDTGCGMSDDVQEHIFEPFFTTKELGKGTGLGLATVYGIIKQSGGYIWVYSEEGHGTSFKIYLPTVEMRAESRAPVPVVQESATRGSETILIVEDDASLREVTCEILRGHGYKVLAAASADDAIRVSEAHVGAIDFLLTDVIMPKTNGRELAAKLSASRPHLKVLYVSGYTDGIIRATPQSVQEPGCAFLQKPHSRHALTRKVREILDATLAKSCTGRR